MVRKVFILSVFSILLSANLVWGVTFNVTTPDMDCVRMPQWRLHVMYG